jgi:hypothetical protein
MKDTIYGNRPLKEYTSEKRLGTAVLEDKLTLCELVKCGLRAHKILQFGTYFVIMLSDMLLVSIILSINAQSI